MSSVRGLKARPQIGHGLAPRLAVEVVEDLAGQDVLLGLVDRVDRLHHPRGQARATWAMWITARMSFGKHEPP